MDYLFGTSFYIKILINKVILVKKSKVQPKLFYYKRMYSRSLFWQKYTVIMLVVVFFTRFTQHLFRDCKPLSQKTVTNI